MRADNLPVLYLRRPPCYSHVPAPGYYRQGAYYRRGLRRGKNTPRVSRVRSHYREAVKLVLIIVQDRAVIKL